MPTTTTTTMATASTTISALLLGRAVERAGPSSSLPKLAELISQTTKATSSSLFTTTSLPLMASSDLGPTLDQQSSMDFGQSSALQQQQVAAAAAAAADGSATALYSLEELGRWASAADCTALVHALLASFSVILVSELGDKTFIITAIMAMKNSRSLVFLSSALALFLMTVLSVGMGVAVTVVPKQYTHYASIVLFLCFGLKMLKEAHDMGAEPEGESEFDEVKRSLEDEVVDPPLKAAPPIGIVAVDDNDNNNNKLGDQPQQQSPTSNSNWSAYVGKLIKTLYIAPVIIKVFTMVFIAEWGDRSQISTVILAAREDVVGVFVGSLSGHVLCTGLAVIGGRFVADVISVRTMTLLGGIIFLFFATFAILTGPES